MRRCSVWTGSAALAAGVLGLLPAPVLAAVHARADSLVPVSFGLPVAKEGQPYRFSIAGAATGGVKPYRCTPTSLDVGSLTLGSNCVISGTAPTLPASTTHRIVGPFRFKLTDSGVAPKTVTLHALNIEVISKTYQFPFDGTWKITQTQTLDTDCSAEGGSSVPPQTGTSTDELEVVHGVLDGHKLSVSGTGITATVTKSLTTAGITFTQRYEFTVTGAVGSVRETITGGGLAGCDLKYHGTGSGSRIST